MMILWKMAKEKFFSKVKYQSINTDEKSWTWFSRGSIKCEIESAIEFYKIWAHLPLPKYIYFIKQKDYEIIHWLLIGERK